VTVTLFDVPGANYTEDGVQTADAVVNEPANETGMATWTETGAAGAQTT